MNENLRIMMISAAKAALAAGIGEFAAHLSGHVNLTTKDGVILAALVASAKFLLKGVDRWMMVRASG